MSQGFVERLKHSPLLGDGAMGTHLYKRGGAGLDRPLEGLNLSNAELVKAVHLDYIRAGAGYCVNLRTTWPRSVFTSCGTTSDGCTEP